MARISKGVKVRGLKEVRRRLNKELDFMDDGIRKGLQAAGIFIKAESKEVAPHDLGILINSAYCSTGKTAKGWTLRIGYTAKYAPYVHEMPASNNFSKPGTGPKFLFNPIIENQNTILRIIQNRMRVR